MPSIHYYRLLTAINGIQNLQDAIRLQEAIGAAKLPPEEAAELGQKIAAAKQALNQIAVAGTSFRQENVMRVNAGDILIMHPDPMGSLMRQLSGDPRGHQDPTAVLLTHEGRHVGYVPKDLAAHYFPMVNAKGTMRCLVAACVGGGMSANGKKPLSYGLRVILPDLETGQEPVIPEPSEV